MAGAGYKLFNTGDVLTAAQVNTYLMEQTVMVFANAAARTTALSGVVSEGMISYLKDTNAVEVYDGSNWVSSDDPNAIQNTIVDAKGDLIAATANDTPARLAVGNNGETLVADSSATTGLRWQGNFAAGKNKIINGDFGIWQRGTSFSSVASGAYSADRWKYQGDGTTNITISRQSFSPGNTIAGYEPEFFYRFAQSSASGQTFNNILLQPIEDVRTFAGQTVTYSFWGKADASRTFTIYAFQSFGSGGSSTVFTTVGSVTLTTSWQRFTYTFSLPSISGKTIGTASTIAVYLQGNANTVMTLDFWGVQLEAGNTATAFQTATGTFAGELLAAQRYYWRTTNTGYGHYGLGYAELATQLNINFKYPVTMRTTPSINSSGAGNLAAYRQGAFVANTSVMTFNQGNADQMLAYCTTAAGSLTQFSPYVLFSNNVSSFVEFSAEL